jgi:primosomal protein N' (replication factor Y)
MHYYEIALLGLSAPMLTYASKETLLEGEVVTVPLKSKLKDGVVLKEVEKPSFDTQQIIKTNYYYSNKQLEIAKFISSYYFSQIGEALALFYPYAKDIEQLKPTFCKVDLPVLTTLQQEAYREIKSKDSSLLFGVTGSGKTEIYIHLISDALKKNKCSLILMPEIALTPQITKRIKHYFGDMVATWHSKVTKKRKEETLQLIREGKIRVVIGARSALFLPLDDIGLIVVDEEHNDSYKAHSRPRYNARDLSLYIAKKVGAKVVLGSATPLVSSYKKLDVIRLKKPYKEAKKSFKFVAGEQINHHILAEIKSVLQKDEQALIFVPTRGNFKYLICSNCAKAQECPYCSIGMSLHSKKRVLRCHYCNYATKIPNSCHSCGSSELTTKREGVAEVIELLQNEFKDVKIEQFDKDSITTANKLAKALDRINKKQSNIVVGTQMLSKGHDYAELTLSVITGLDYIVAIGDFRAKERAVALLHQIAGRSGRAKDAVVVVQSSQADFFVPYLKDYEDFLKEELGFREMANYPPFANLARVLIANKDYKKAHNCMQKALSIIKEDKLVEIVGYGASPVERIANKWRLFILLRSSKKINLLKILHQITDIENIEIDMDPVDFS